MIKQKIHNKKIYSAFLLVFMLFELIFSTFSVPASAEVITYSDVLDDLSKDENFNVKDYPLLTYDEYASLNGDNNPKNDVEYLSVLHIGESEDNELFIYTYQPLNNISDITASTILMSIGDESTDYKKYNLKCVSFNGPFKKYKVLDLKVSYDVLRYYNIVEIERPFDTLLDEKISDETITNYKAHDVGQTWCCYYSTTGLVYEMATLEVALITPTLTDFLFLEHGIFWGNIVGLDTAGHAHFIAFNIDNYDAGKIIDADIEFKTIPYQEWKRINYIAGIESSRDTSLKYKNTLNEWVSSPDVSDWMPDKFTITEGQKRKYEGKGLLAREYKWDRIMTASDFVNKMEEQGVVFTLSTKESLNNSQFVFAFKETELMISDPLPVYNDMGFIQYDEYSEEGTRVGYVDVIRIKFMVGEKTYNLGVVSDTTSADDVPGGNGGGLDTPDIDLKELEDTMEMLFALVCLAIALIAFSFFIGPIKTFFKLLWHGTKSLFEMLWSILTLPIQIFAQLISNLRKK